ncbi:MAG: DUF5077 domain-containing protein, partial [Bacteroidota bacterium]|nr:DUF5077 domain-containing protein [Bacteroidota bacterium]
MQRYFTFIICLVFSSVLSAQKNVSIPAFTAYAVPAENEEDDLFDKKDSSLEWKDENQKIEFHFFIRDTGSININLRAKNSFSTNNILLQIADKKFSVLIPQSNSYKTYKAGKVHINQPGFYTATLASLNFKNKFFTNIQSLQLNGTAVNGIHFNSKPRRNAASVHLKYPVNDSNKVSQFYNEITVSKGFDHLHSYYMACGFSRGYLGIQVNSKNERRVIFSVWDAGNESVDRNKVADSNKVQLMAKGEDVI